MATGKRDALRFAPGVARADWAGLHDDATGGKEEAALDRTEAVASAQAGQPRIAVPKALAKAILPEVEPLPKNLAGAAWTGSIRRRVAQAGGARLAIRRARSSQIL